MYTLLLTLGIASGLAIFAQPGVPGTNAPVREGGIFRISLAAGSGIDHLDPALAYTPAAWALLDTVCARLLTYPDKPPPASFGPVPEVAAGLPKRSRDLRTYTFTLRSGFRFNDGTPVRASAFARAINRMLAQGVASPGVQLVRDIVGAAEVRAGKTPAAAGVVARGNTLVVRFTRPVSDFAARTTTPFFCAVPPTLPADPEGVEAVPRSGAVLRRRVQTRRARRHPAQPLLRRQPATPRRRIRRRPPGRVAAGDAEPRQAGRGRLGSHRRRNLLRPVPGSRLDVRRQRLAVLRQAWADVEDARVQLVATALSRQSEAATRRQLRPRPAGAPVRRPTLERADRPVPALHTAGVPRTRTSTRSTAPMWRRRES